VDDIAAEAGTRVIRAPVGEVNVATRMRAENAPIGGEGNGGVILSELHLGRDAPVGAALMLQLLLEESKPLSKIVAQYPRYIIFKDKLDRPNAPLDAVYEALRKHFADAEVDTQDGLRLTWDGSHSFVQVFSGDTLAPERRRRGLAAEPMSCAADAFNSGEGLAVLQPGDYRSGSWNLRALT